jgi:hypothetical protein
MMGGPNTQQFAPDGTFEFLRVAPGNYSISVVPSNPLLPSIQLVVNDKDTQVGMPAGPGFKVSGNVGRGPQSPRPPNLRVVLTGSTAWSQLETPVNGSGEFEFASVPGGTYSLRTIPGSSSDVSQLVVADREIRGFVLPAQVPLAGHVLLEDGTTLPLSSMALMIEAIRTDGVTFASATNREGKFKLPLNEGAYRIAAGRLPPGLSVKSISYGSTDISTNPINLDGTSAPAEIRLLLRKRGN